ncbi:DNA primase [Mangrovactinospora gilvigrisea]|uniref:DNA primase n=1 Tax=Mangrovactinospora gilvigrisea TaxID=1428644 RepID=A0A1J7C9Q5_9ACTN|nr:DNA primase [Mangrovactinospora gilvigrisea]OIV36378.1 DNA primase [Mangrovactinospora gilvigrisea]
MAGRIRDEDIKAVRDTVPIDTVVGDHLQLRNAGGGQLKGLCPFHDEKSPSFHVSPSKGLYHCLAGETRVLTWEGVRPIRELAGTTAKVLGRGANWVEAPFKSFGVQPLLRIVLSRNGRTKEIHATDQHRWFLRAGRERSSLREVVTADLKAGDRLGYVFPGSRIEQTTPSPSGIAHGITFGDGMLDSSGATAQLDPVKELPPLSESAPYLYGFLAGYLAAGGHVAKDGTVVLDCTRREVLEGVRTLCTRLGIGTYGVTEQVREGVPGREPSPVHRIHLVAQDLTEQFFLDDEHRSRFLAPEKDFARRGWVVESVEPTDRVEEVYCATVPDGHAFVLEDNILTGNCFGCGEGGDAIKFVQQVEHLTFAEAVERLAAQAGIELRYEDGGYSPGRQKGERTRLVEANKAAAAWFTEQLGGQEALVARQFLADRGFDAAAAEQFALGYAPVGWENLVRFLRGKGFTDKELLTSGLASEGRRGPMDRFRGRLVWPIKDLTGEVIGFGARRLREDDNGPKYLNTPETPLYKKSQVLYGIEQAKKEIAKTGRAVVVEGYTDVMACHLAGVPTAIATCGTAFGGDHIKILRRLLMDTGEFRGEVVFTFDGDAAGQKAAMRAFEDDQKFVTRTFVAVEPNGMDPCDLRLAKGDDAVRELVDARVPLFEFAVRTTVDRYNLDTEEGRIAALDAAAPIVARIKDYAVRTRYAVRLDKLIGFMDEEFIRKRVMWEERRLRERQARPERPEERRRGGAEAPEAAPAAPARPVLDPRDPAQQAERELLKLALQAPALVVPLDAYQDDEFTAAPYRAVRLALGAAGGVAAGAAPAADSGAAFVAAVRDACPDDMVRGLVTELAVEPLRTHREVDALYAGGFLVAVRRQAVDRRIAEVQKYLQRNSGRLPDDQLRAVQAELSALQGYRHALVTRGADAL